MKNKNMKQLRFTTTEPYGMFAFTNNYELLVKPDDIGTLSKYKPKESN